MGRKHSQKVKISSSDNILERYGLGTEDEHLDFELDDRSDEYDICSNEGEGSSASDSDDSTINLQNSNSQELISSTSTKTVDRNESLKASSISHRNEMLNLIPSSSDRQQSDYLQLINIDQSSTTLLDSSDDSNDGEDTMMTADEENDLLGSENEYDENSEIMNVSSICDVNVMSEPSIDTQNIMRNAKICVIGDKRTVIGENETLHNLKRTTNEIFRVKQPKRTKWNATFTNGFKPVRVFLEDIGYESQKAIEKNENRNLINNNNIDCVSLTHQQSVTSGSGTFRITLNRETDSRVCKQVGSANSLTFSDSENSSINSSFKIPLPPAKRPPSRPRKTPSELSRRGYVRTISNVGSNSQISISTRASDVGDDDALSLVAPDISTDERFEIETKKEPMSDTDERMSSPFEDVDNRVNQWVQEVQENCRQNLGIQPLMAHPIQLNPDSIVNSAKGNHRVDFRTIPAFFQGICFHYYFNQNCIRVRCNLPHVVNVNKFTQKGCSLSPCQLLESYKFILQHNLKYLYKEIYPCFITGFAHHKMKHELISCIKDFYNFTEVVNLFDAIEMVVKCLQEMGLSLLEATEKLIWTFGLTLQDFPQIILELITARPEISENWPMIKRIIQTLDQITPKLAMKIFRLATHVYPLNRNLLVDIHEVIIKSKLTDLSQISEEALLPFKTLTEFNGNTTSRSPVTQREKRLPVADNFELLQNSQKALNQNNKNINDTNQLNNNRRRGRANYIDNTNNIYYSSDLDSEHQQTVPTIQFRRTIENTNHSLQSSSSSSRDDSVFSDTQYIPQHILPETRQDTNYRSVSKQTEFKLSPLPPVIATTSLPEQFELNNSLHYLCPEVIKYPVSLDECDHLILKRAIIEIDSFQFLKLLDKYRNPVTLENFIIMTIINLKDTLKEAATTLKALLNSLGVDSQDSHTKKLIKVVFEVTVMNLLTEMEKVCYWNDAVQLLEHFTDWDGIASSQLFQTFGARRFTHMGKYIFLAMLFNKGRNFHYTYRILMSPELHLLSAPSSWPFFNSVGTDLKYRNEVLDEFLRAGYTNYLLGALQIHKYMLTSDDMYGYNRRQQQEYLNAMLLSILASSKPASLVYCFNFLDCFYKILDKSILRTMASAVVERLSKNHLIQLYEFCCKREIYQSYSGEESKVVIRTDNTDSEIILIFMYFFHRRSKVLLPLTSDICIDIKLQENSETYIKMLQNCIRSIVDTNMAVKNILRDNFNILVRNSSNSTSLEIPVHEVTRVLTEQYDWRSQL